MIQFLLPPGIYIVKKVIEINVGNAINSSIDEGTRVARNETIKHLKRGIIETLINITMNVVLLLLSIYVAPYFFSEKAVIFLICSIYLSSIIHSVVKFFLRLPVFFKLIVEYKLNVKEYIEDEIYAQVYAESCREIRNLNFFKRMCNNMFGQSASQIASAISRSATSVVMATAIKLIIVNIIIIASYIFIFRSIVAPSLILDATNLGLIETALYPILYSVDYFCESNLVTLMKGMLN